MIKYLIVIGLALIITIEWACLMASKTSDEQAERMWQEYQEYKKKKEK